jgi:drug/metabolite transporter (DMT)-like permease
MYYPLVERLLHRFSVAFLLGVSQLLPILLLVLLAHRTVAQDLTKLGPTRWEDWLALAALPLLSLAANAFSYLAIREKNASLVALLEISYPLFTILFAYLLFREFQLTTASTFGAILMLGGAALLALGK